MTWLSGPGPWWIALAIIWSALGYLGWRAEIRARRSGR
jgi:hypothetical protein